MTLETIWGIVGTACAIIFGYLAFARNRKTDDQSEARQDGMILTEIGYIKGGIDDIKTEQREQRKVNTDLYTKVTAVEQSAKQAHKRIDRLECLEEK